MLPFIEPMGLLAGVTLYCVQSLRQLHLIKKCLLATKPIKKGRLCLPLTHSPRKFLPWNLYFSSTRSFRLIHNKPIIQSLSVP